MNELDRIAHRRPAAIHRADLHDLVVPRRRLDHLAAFPHRVRRGLLDVDVLAGLERPDGGERVPVVRRGDDDGVDVLVVEHAPQILHEPRLERGDFRQARVVDPLGRQIRVDVAEGLDFYVREPREPALERVALTANADAGGDDAIVGAEDAAADVRAPRGPRRIEQLAANRDARRRRSHSGCKFAPRNTALLVLVVGHADLLVIRHIVAPKVGRQEGQVGQVGQVGRVGQVGQVGRVGRVGGGWDRISRKEARFMRKLLIIAATVVAIALTTTRSRPAAAPCTSRCTKARRWPQLFRPTAGRSRSICSGRSGRCRRAAASRSRSPTCRWTRDSRRGRRMEAASRSRRTAAARGRSGR